MALLTSLAMLATGLVAVAATTATAASSAVAVTITHANESGGTSGAGDLVLAGEDARFTVRADNSSAVAAYNLAVVLDLPMGISWVASAGWGEPVRYLEGESLPGTDPAELVAPGMQRWVWEDVSDLPAGAANAAVLTVRPDQPMAVAGSETSSAVVFPAGSSFSVSTVAAVSDDPRYLPVLPGSTGVAGPEAEAATAVSAADVATTRVGALRVTKAEPSPESELQRGVHGRTTVYTVSVETTTEGVNAGSTVVDYLPAGLEFLGCGAVDNTTPGVVEHELSPRLDGTPSVPAMGGFTGSPQVRTGCLTPTSVQTVQDDPSAPSSAVHTKVTWMLGDLPAGSVTHLRYAAGIPLLENTLWNGTVPDVTGAQTANLDNNDGPSTRHGLGAPGPVDGDTWVNRAIAVATYGGVVRTATSRAVSEHDDELVHVMDLAVVKAVASGSPTTFTQGDEVEFDLRLRTSEYTQSSAVVLTDTLPNGLCPIVPLGTPVLDNGGALDCIGTGVVVGGSVSQVTANADGTYVITLHPDIDALPAGHEHVITYSALMRADYTDADAYGSTTSGDRFVNTVEVTGTTTSALTTGDLAAYLDETGPEQVWDDSEASLDSDLTTISKQVMPRDDVERDVAGDPCTIGPFADAVATDFRLGDTVCFELTVDFADSVHTRAAQVTDVLPTGLVLDGWGVAAESTVPLEQVEASVDAASGRMAWDVGDLDPDDGERYVAPGAVLVLHVWGTVIEPGDVPGMDKPENLMKYRQQSVTGEVFFLRDEASIEVLPSPVSLVKGVAQVGGDALRPADTDGVEVREGEVVTYRVDLASDYDTYDVVVWDLLPAGITADDVSAITHGGVALDPGETGHPGGSLDGDPKRSIIRWSGMSLPVGATTLTYDVRIPAATSVSTTLPNTASVISYRADVNGDTVPEDYLPTGSLDATTEGTVPGSQTRDDSAVHLPDASVAKAVTSPTDTNNTATQVVKGEAATFTYTVTIPAHSSVLKGVLSDTLPTPTNWTLLGATVTYPVDLTVAQTEFAFDAAAGTLTFPDLYDNTTGTDQVFTVVLTASVKPAATWTHSTATARTNTARFRSTGSPDRTGQASVYLIEPAPRLSKTVNDADGVVTAGQVLVYTLTASNTAGRPTAHATVVTDCLPAGLFFNALGAATQGSATSSTVDPACADGRTMVTWNVGSIAGGGSATLTVTATVDPTVAGGATYVNSADLVAYSLAGGSGQTYVDDADATVTVVSATIDKSVDAATATVGQEREYTITATLPAKVNFYDATITDVLPAGLDANGDFAVVTSGDDPPTPILVGTPGATGPFTWSLGDIASSETERTVTITYTGTVLDVVDTVTGTQLTNTATLSWNPADGGDTTDPGRLSEADSATVTVQQPAVAITKKVNTLDADTVDPGEPFGYAVRVVNTGTSTAYDVEVVDTVPEGVIVSLVSGAGVLTGADALTGGGTLAWSLDALAVGAANAVTLTYTGTLAPSGTLDGTGLTNTADVAGYFSHPSGAGYDDDERRGYDGPAADAVVTPGFPELVVTKSADTGPVYIGQGHAFTITVKNSGAGPAQGVEAVDTLPVGWEYVAGSAQVAGTDVEPVLTGTAATQQVLTWELPDLAVDADAVVTYRALPSALHAWDASTTGSAVAHVNEVVVSGTDTSGADHHGSGTDQVDYTDSADATVHIHRADLAIDKAHTGPVIAGTDLSWTVTVTNAATADPAAGPIVVTDALPDGVTYVGIAGAGWVATGPDADGLLTLTHAGPVAAGASLPVAVVTVHVPADTADETDVSNTVTVEGKTFETATGDNEDTDPGAVTVRADLEIGKKALGTTYVAGEDISWTLDVVNHGPSLSRTPFTVTDTLPAGVATDSLEVSGTDWAVTSVAGQVVTLTYSGDHLGVDPDVDDATPTVTLTAEVLPSWTTTLLNTAEVHPVTREPSTLQAVENNTDTATTGGVGTSADLSLVKTVASTDLVAGAGGRYRIAIANAGPSDALNVTVSDVLPQGVTYAGGVASSTDDVWEIVGAPVDNGDGSTTVTFELTSELGTLPDGGSSWLELDVDLASSVASDVTNTATVSSDTPDPDGSDNTDDVTRTPEVETNISVAKSHPSAVRRVGDPVTFTIEVTNDGAADAATVVLTDALPAGLTLTGVAVPVVPIGTRTWTDTTVGDLLTLTLDGALAAGETASVEVTAILTAASYPSADNVVSVTTTTQESTVSDNEATDTVRVDSPDLRVVKAADTDSVQGGETITWTLTVTNHGGARADTVTLTDTLPAEVVHLASDWDTRDPALAVGDPCVVSGQSGDGTGGTLDCALPAGLAAGQSAVVTVDVGVPDDVAVDTITNAVTVASPEEDPSVTGDNDDDESVDVRWLDISLAAQCVLDAPWLTYDVDARNVPAGLPIHLTWFPDADLDGVADGPAVRTQTLGRTPPTGTALTGRVLWPGAAVDADGVGIGWPGYRVARTGETPTTENQLLDPTLPEYLLRAGTLLEVTVNPAATLTVSYPPAADACAVTRAPLLDLTKTASVAEAAAGSSFSYAVVVQNDGPGATDDVIVTDPVPGMLKVTGVTVADPGDPTTAPWQECTVTGRDARGYGGTVTCALDGWLGFGQRTPTITVTVVHNRAAGAGEVVNVATASWTDPDATSGGTASSTGTATVRVRAVALGATGGQVLGMLVLTLLLLTGGGALLWLRRGSVGRRATRFPGTTPMA